jgi:hypothetical protein
LLPTVYHKCIQVTVEDGEDSYPQVGGYACLAYNCCRGSGETSQYETSDRLHYKLCHINTAKEILQKEEVLG